MRPAKVLLPLTGAVCFVLASAIARADTVIIQAAKDATLYQNASGLVANGAGAHIFAGRTNQDGVNPVATISIRRALLKFDIAAAVPAGATINSVILRLQCTRTRTTTNRLISIRRVLTDWNEGPSDDASNEGSGTNSMPGDVTWTHTLFPTMFWTAPGGDFSGTLSGSLNVGAIGTYNWNSTSGGNGQMAVDVQNWLNNPATNFGWILSGVETTGSTAKRFDSRTNSTVANRPQLTINFTPAPDTTAPTCTITTPTGDPTFATSTSPINLAGTASDNVAVTQVNWDNSLGGSGSATGTTNWSITGIVLSPGDNVITVRARDAAMNEGTDVLTVTFTPGDPPMIDPIADQVATPGLPFASLTPSAAGTPPITWSLLNGPPGAIIDDMTGQVTWSTALPANLPYVVEVEAVNMFGADTELWDLTCLPGDFSGDGQLDSADVPPLVDHLLGLDSSNPIAADVNLDMTLDGEDAVAFAAGL